MGTNTIFLGEVHTSALHRYATCIGFGAEERLFMLLGSGKGKTDTAELRTQVRSLLSNQRHLPKRPDGFPAWASLCKFHIMQFNPRDMSQTTQSRLCLIQHAAVRL